MIGRCHIEIDARDVSEIAAVLMSLEKEMAAIIVARRGATGIMIKNEISVFVRLSATASAQVSELRDYARGILEQIEAFDDEPGSKFRRKDIVGDHDWIGRGHATYVLLKTRTLSAAAFEAAMVASAIVAATNEQDLACSRFLRVSFMIWLVFDWFCFRLRGN